MFSDPIKNLKAFGLRDDNIVADLGAGTGFYSVGTGQIVTRGKVYAIEINKDFLETIKHKVKDAHLDNVEIIWGDIEKRGGTKLADGVVDAVIASNVLSQVEDKEKFIEETKRILKPHGKALIIDWSPDSSVISLKRAIAKSVAQTMFEKKGFTVERTVDAGAHHYGIIVSKN